MSFAFIPLYIKYLGVESYGLVGIFGLLMACLSLLDIGMTPTLSKEMANFKGGVKTKEYIHDFLRSIEIVSLVIAVFIVVLVFSTSGWFASKWLNVKTLPRSVVQQALILMGVVISFRFLEGIYRSALLGLQYHVIFNVTNASTATIRAIGALLILKYISSTIEAFFIWQAIISLFSTGALLIATYSKLPAIDRRSKFAFSSLQGVSKFAGGIMVLSMFTIVISQLDKIILSKKLTLTDYSYYSIASVLANLLFIVANPLISTFYPRFCELYGTRQHTLLTQTFRKSTQLMTFFCGTIGTVLIVFSQEILYAWTHDLELSSNITFLLKILTLANLFNCLYLLPTQMQLSMGWTKLSIILNLVAVCVFIPLFFWSISVYGVLGAAITNSLLYFYFFTAGSVIMFNHLFSLKKLSWYATDIVFPLSLGLLTASTIQVTIPAPETFAKTVIYLVVATLLIGSVLIFTLGSIRYNVLKTMTSIVNRLKQTRT